MNNPPTPANAPKILVADDNPIILRTISDALKSAGYHPLTAAQPSEAVGLVRTQKPDLILLDLNFPPDGGNISGLLRDGFVVLEWLHYLVETKNTPVIIISGTEPEKHQDRALAAGAVACLRKPIDNQQLLAAVESALHPQPAAGEANFEV